MAESLRRAVRIANCSGFSGDRIVAAREMLAAPVDVLTGDYLAELTVLNLWIRPTPTPTPTSSSPSHLTGRRLTSSAQEA